MKSYPFAGDLQSIHSEMRKNPEKKQLCSTWVKKTFLSSRAIYVSSLHHVMPADYECQAQWKWFQLEVCAATNYFVFDFDRPVSTISFNSTIWSNSEIKWDITNSIYKCNKCSIPSKNLNNFLFKLNSAERNSEEPFRFASFLIHIPFMSQETK